MWTYLLILCIMLPLCARFAPNICIYLWLKLKGRADEVEDIKLEIADLKQQQSEISMTDEFAKHAKLNRKITAKTNTLKTIQQNQMWIRMKAYWYTKIGVYILSTVLFAAFRYEPVLFFDIDNYLGNPIVYVMAIILAFPSGIPGAVGMAVGLFVCNRAVNQLLNIIIPLTQVQKEMLHEPVE